MVADLPTPLLRLPTLSLQLPFWYHDSLRGPLYYISFESVQFLLRVGDSVAVESSHPKVVED
jgi:hypothetical protein